MSSSPMTECVDYLILDLLEWLGEGPRPYAEVLEAWRTSCPRLPVWEEANDRGYIRRHRAVGMGPLVSASDSGVRHLRSHRLQNERLGDRSEGSIDGKRPRDSAAAPPGRARLNHRAFGTDPRLGA